MSRLSNLIAISAIFTAGVASANGFGESVSFQFRSPAERQILLQGEQTRLNYKVYEDSRDAAAAAASGGQTGNSLSITISGNGDNTIDVGQDNTGDQTIQESEGGSTNTIGGEPAPAATALSPSSIDEAVAVMNAIPVSAAGE
jgi:hypothetical protein